jgi:uncharacterized membrane protein
MVSIVRSRTAARSRDEEGAITVLAGVLLLAIMAATSLAVDVGRVAYASRDQQGATERAALDAVSLLQDGSTVPVGDQAAATWEEAVEALLRNPGASGTALDRHVVCVTVGHVGPERGAQFIPLSSATYSEVPAGFPPLPSGENTCPGTDPSEVPIVDLDRNAVWVRTASFVPFVFPFPARADGPNGRWVTETSVARLTEPVAAISIATTTASIGGGLLGALLETLDEDWNVDVTVIGHEGAAVPTVTLGDLLDAAGKVGTPEELVDVDVSIAEVATAALELLVVGDEDDASVAAGVLDVLEAMASMQVGHVSLGEVLTVSGDERAALRTGIEVFTLIDALAHAEVANLEHAISADALVGDGILAADLLVIEPPQIAIGPAGEDAEGDWRTEAKTAQLALELEIDLEALHDQIPGALEEAIEELLDALLGVVNGLLDGVTCTLLGLVVDCPSDVDVGLGTVGVTVNLARGSAGLEDISCSEDGAVSTDVMLSTVSASASSSPLAEVSGDKEGAVLLDLGWDAAVGTTHQQRVIQGPFAAWADPVTAGQFDLGLGLTVTSLTGTGHLSGEVGDLHGPVENLIKSLVGPGGPLVDDGGELPSELGVGLAVAEVGALETRCGSRALARGDRWLTVVDGEDDLDG